MLRASLAALLLSGAVLAAPGGKSREQIVDRALSLKGTPYVWAGTSSKGFDCSGFIYRMMQDGGYEVPRMADEQFYATRRVQRKELRRGDLVFFSTYLPGPSHVGIFLGQGKFVHASSAGGGVIVSQMNDGYYSQAFIGGGRPQGYPAPEGPTVAVVPPPTPVAAVTGSKKSLQIATDPQVVSAAVDAAQSQPAPAATLAPPAVTTAPSPNAPAVAAAAAVPSPAVPDSQAPTLAEALNGSAPSASPLAPAVAAAAVAAAPTEPGSAAAPSLAVAATYALELAPEVFTIPEPVLDGSPSPNPGAPVVLTDAGPPTMVASAPSPTPPPTEVTLPADLAAPRGVQVDQTLLQVWQVVRSWFS